MPNHTPESEYLRVLGTAIAPRLVIIRGIAAAQADDISNELILLTSNFIPVLRVNALAMCNIQRIKNFWLYNLRN